MNRLSRLNRKLAGIGLAIGLMAGSAGLGLVLAGWGASTGTASQTFTVGSGLIVTLTSTTPGATVAGNVVTCPGILINDPSGIDAVGCTFSIAESVAPSSVTVIETSSKPSLNKFSLTYYVNGEGIQSDFVMNAPYSLKGNPAMTLPLPVTSPLVIKGALGWGTVSQLGGTGTPLGQSDWGAVLTTVSYAITVTP